MKKPSQSMLYVPLDEHPAFLRQNLQNVCARAGFCTLHLDAISFFHPDSMMLYGSDGERSVIVEIRWTGECYEVFKECQVPICA